MRPGPGLVVMALAFISGARRGSTNTSSKASSSSSESSSSASSPSSSYEPQLIKSERNNFLFPFYISHGGRYFPFSVDSIKTKPPPQPPDNGDRKRQRTAHPTNDFYHFYYNYNSPTPSRQAHTIITEQEHRQKHKVPSAFREIRSIDTEVTESHTLKNAVIRAGDEIGDALAEADTDTEEDTSDTNSVNDNSSSSGSSDSNSADNEATSEGLLIQFPSIAVDSSRSFDSDNIFALVAEDDLLSEDSFDRLTKLTDDKIGYINEEEVEDEEDYAGSSINSGTERVVSSIERSQYTAAEIEEETSSQSTTFSTTTTTTATSSEDDEDGDENSSSIATISASTIDDVDEKNLGNSAGADGERHDDNKENDGNNIDTNDLYASNLISNNELSAIAENGAKNQLSNSLKSLSQTLAESTTAKSTELRKSLFESESPLTRLNPWISACDLAQPGTAPDLQGQCSSGTLPMAWVDEGPGPPACPKSCEQLRLSNKHKMSILNKLKTNSNNNNNKNKIKYFINSETTSFKLSNNNNNNYYYDSDNKLRMAKVRRELSESVNIEEAGTTTATTSTATTTAKTTTTKPDVASLKQNGELNQNNNNNNNIKLTKQQSKENMPLKAESSSSETRSSSSLAYNSLNFDEFPLKYNNLNLELNANDVNDYEKDEQCLDYLGDTQDASPVRLCSLKSPKELMAHLRTLRLRHCCERNVLSALHTLALNATLSGGTDCVRILTDIMDLDALATRITCELAEILFRFDCRQVYSLINQCDDCREAYRRWVCSTLIPYFAEPGDVLLNKANDGDDSNNTERNKNTKDPSGSSNNIKNNNNSNKTPVKRATNTSNDNKIAAKSQAIQEHNKMVKSIDSDAKINSSSKMVKRNTNSISNHSNNGDYNFNGRSNNTNNEKKNEFMNGNERRKRGSNNGNHRNNNKNVEISKTKATSTARRNYADKIVNYETSGSSTSTSSSSKTRKNIKNNYGTKATASATATATAIQTTVAVRTTDEMATIISNNSCRHSRSHDEFQHALKKSNNNFISTAGNKNHPSSSTSSSCAGSNAIVDVDDNSVISKLLKRSKRKIEFRKRRRIRPCINVCQTVEQKCPYLLPADRAPALPTQYAGEPTFLCLDQNIGETGEQLHRSIYGPTNCCYSYCGDVASGICTYCTAFAMTDITDMPLSENMTTTSIGRVHNYTLTITREKQEQQMNSRVSALANDTRARAASIAIALRNTTNALAALERLPYYAYFDGTYYYDDELHDMPDEALSEHCPPVPSVTSRCTIPYYASAATATTHRLKSQSTLLIWLSVLLCSFSGYNATQQRWRRKRTTATTETTTAAANYAMQKTQLTLQYCTTLTLHSNTNSFNIREYNNYANADKECLKFKFHTTTNTNSKNCSSIKCSSNKCKHKHARCASGRNNSNNKLSTTTKLPLLCHNSSLRPNSNKFMKNTLENCQKTINNNNNNKYNNITIKSKILNKKISIRSLVLAYYRSRINRSFTFSLSKLNNKLNNYSRKCYTLRPSKRHIAALKRNFSKKFIKYKNYRFFYHYNFNINDWWHRWWWWTRRLRALCIRKRLRRRQLALVVIRKYNTYL